MKLKLKRYALILTSLLTLAAPAAFSFGSAYAASCGNIAAQTSIGANKAANNNVGASTCGSQSGAGSDTVTKVASHIVNIFSLIVGAVSVIMIIFGGFRYITSGGESGRVGSAKNTLIYAIIGLIIVILAQLIVHLVLTNTSNAVTPGS